MLIEKTVFLVRGECGEIVYFLKYGVRKVRQRWSLLSEYLACVCHDFMKMDRRLNDASDYVDELKPYLIQTYFEKSRFQECGPTGYSLGYDPSILQLRCMKNQRDSNDGNGLNLSCLSKNCINALSKPF
jgi:hypothetical protein